MASAERPSCRGPGREERATQMSSRLAYLRRTLAPLVSTTDHSVHPDFPATMLHYHLLTSPQLDALARHYHQSSPKAESWSYPVSIVGRWTVPSTPSPPSPTTTTPSPSTLNATPPSSPPPTTTTTPSSSAPTSTLSSSPTSSALTITAAIMGLEPTSTPRQAGSKPPTRRKASVRARKRRFGRFIGLHGCHSPTVSAAEAIRQEGRCVDLWVERETLRRARLDNGPKGFMF